MSKQDRSVPSKTQSPECPECGHAYANQLESGWANDGTLPLRSYTCVNACGTYMSVELVLPKGVTSMSALDENYRKRRRDSARKKHGYHGTPPRGGFRLLSDRIKGTLYIVPGKTLGKQREYDKNKHVIVISEQIA